jgi:hypothetical protein
MPTTTRGGRPETGNANHHLWNNHGTWWCHFTLHFADFTKARVRVGLDTRDATVARARRDALLRLFGPQLAGAAPAAAGTQVL